MINRKPYPLETRRALLLLALVTACGGGSDGGASGAPMAGSSSDGGTSGGTTAGDSGGGGSSGGTTAGDSGGTTAGDSGQAGARSVPTVLSSTPERGAIGVALNGNASATFSEAMDPATLSAKTFTLTSGKPAVPVAGTVTYADGTAAFWPAARFARDTTFTATITTGVESAHGVALAAKHAWTFTTGDSAASGGLPVNLASAGDFVILAKSGISTVPASVVTGDLGVGPAAATYITGFSLIADSTNVFSTSSQVIGKVYAANYEPPTPSNLTTAVSDMELAFTDAASRAPDVSELGAGDIGGMTLAPGVYRWGTGLLIPADVTLAGGATSVWIFQIAQNLTMGSATNIFLTGGALAKNIFWQVSGNVVLGTTAHFEGVVLAQTAVTLRTGASINGRLLAQTAVNIDGSTVVEPAE